MKKELPQSSTFELKYWKSLKELPEKLAGPATKLFVGVNDISFRLDKDLETQMRDRVDATRRIVNASGAAAKLICRILILTTRQLIQEFGDEPLSTGLDEDWLPLRLDTIGGCYIPHQPDVARIAWLASAAR